jgi:hypothetical protein
VEVGAREVATTAAMLEATRVPLRTAEACLRVVEFAARAAKSGNRNAVTDAGVAGLTESRRIGQAGMALGLRHSDRLELPGADVGNSGRDGAEDQVDGTADRIADCGAEAFVGNMRQSIVAESRGLGRDVLTRSQRCVGRFFFFASAIVATLDGWGLVIKTSPRSPRQIGANRAACPGRVGYTPG